MPLDEQSRRLTQFVIGNQQYEFNRLFYGISIGPAAFSAFMSKIFQPLILKKNAITYLDDVFMQSQTKEEMFTVLEHYHKILQNKNLKAAPDKSHFFLTRVKFLGHNIERNTITPLKSRLDAIQKLQPPTNKKKIQEFFGMLNFLRKYVYKMQLYLRPFYNILRQQNNFEWTTEHQTRFEEIKKLIKFYLAKDETSPRLECKYAVKTDIDQSQINNLQHFPLYLDCQNNHYEVDLLGSSTFKPIPHSQWIKKNTQQKKVKQQSQKKDLFPLIEKENLTDKISLSGPQTKDSKYTIF